MKILIIVMFMLALSSPALAVKPGTELSGKMVGVSINTTPLGGGYFNFLHMTGVCREFGESAVVANTAEFITAIGDGLAVPNDGSYIIMRVSEMTGVNGVDIYANVPVRVGGFVNFSSNFGSFVNPAGATNYKVACIY